MWFKKHYRSNTVVGWTTTIKESGELGCGNGLSAESAVIHIQRLIEMFITPRNPAYSLAYQLLAEYRITNKVESLLRSYTLETPFYKKLNATDDSAKYFPVLIYYHLKALKDCSVQGRSFREISTAQKI